MEHRNNKKVIIVIALLLLVGVIGLSFAYFTASTTRNNLTTSAVDTTVTIDNTEFIIEGKLAINDLNILPGHKSVSSIKVTAKGDHTINYNLIWDGINSLERLDYKVYKTTEEIVPTTTCRRITEEDNGLTKYYEECNISEIDSLGEVISSGSINKNTKITKEVLKSNESITATKEGETVYYYVVLEFPNLDKDQNIDMNSRFEGEITVESDEVEFPMNVSKVLSKYTKDDSRTGQITAAFKERTPTTVYSKEDDNGTSYVFAGENPNNWVKLGNLYFRIIRFNGDGSLRLIYSGEGSTQIIGEGTQIGIKELNNTATDNIYVGLQYMSEQVHGTEINSTVLGTDTSTDTTTLYGWYNSKIKPSYANIIDSNAGFCSDREPSTLNSSSNGAGGTGTTETYYGGYIRYVKGGVWQTTYEPTLKCKNTNDNLKIPVGLITADEYMLAGGGSPLNGTNYYNITFWLHTGQSYLTMSPSNFDRTYAWMFFAHYEGYLANWYVHHGFGVRPVINLKSTTKFINNGTGDPGTSTNPYEVVIS